MGEVVNFTPRPFLRQWVFNNTKDNQYRKIVTLKGHLIGAIGYGEWPEIRRIQEAYQNRRKLYPWHYLRFFLTGEIWGDSSNDDPNLWPATTVVCQCNSITQGALVDTCLWVVYADSRKALWTNRNTHQRIHMAYAVHC